MGKYLKAEWKYFIKTKAYICYCIWIVTSFLGASVTRFQYEMFQHGGPDPMLSALTVFMDLGLSLINLLFPVLIIIIYVQSIISVFSEGAYRNVFALNISRMKWLSSKAFIYTGVYLLTYLLIFGMNEIFAITYPQMTVFWRSSTSAFKYGGGVFVVNILALVALIIIFHAVATWLAISFRKTAPTILTLLFGAIGVQIFAALFYFFLLIAAMSNKMNGFSVFLAYPIPGCMFGLIALSFPESEVANIYLNVGLTVVFQTAYAIFFSFLAIRKINKLDF